MAKLKKASQKTIENASSSQQTNKTTASKNIFSTSNNNNNSSSQKKDEKKFQKKTPTIGPEYRILLVAGPPGVGKTTLAHIAAKQAGYDPIEVNASDDRSKEKLIPEIQKVTQMQTVFGSKKPKLLILDEIDGVQNSENKSVISEILKLAYPKQTKEKDGDAKQQKKTSKNKSGLKVEKKTKKKKEKGLMRPIICICNDQ